MPDSPAGVSGEIIGRHPLPSSDSPEAFDLIERWMSTCLAKHEACRETLSGSAIDETMPPTLPTRVIHVGCPEEGLLPRLVQTDGKQAHYTALSHCWGPPTHHPPMTTQSTLVDHLTGIPWDLLPRTYQDAMVTTRRLGFDYIWIDSLCVVQDSHADWLSESKRMGDVYQHARLTIAASHAADSTQSCFFTRPPPLPTVELPHLTAAGSVEGSIFATLLPPDYTVISPDSGVLAYRAWATQEWLLSRRMVFYTAGCIAWSCKVVSQRETGASFHATARNSRWKNIIEKYSARLLTKQTDRLIALDGVKAALAAKKPDDQCCLGIWRKSMPDQLLWYSLQPAERSGSDLELPTWTWASTLHGVRFLTIHGAKNACTRFRFNESTSSLTVRGAVRKVSSVSPFATKDIAQPHFESVLYDTVSDDMLYALHADGGHIIGGCVLDEGLLMDSDIYCLRLMHRRTQSRASNVVHKVSEEWVLCLRMLADDESYERVGVGKITTDVPWFQDCRTEDICLR